MNPWRTRRYEVEQKQELGNWLVVSRHGEYDRANEALDELRLHQKRARIVEVTEERQVVAATILP